MKNANNRRRTYIVRMEFQKEFIIRYCMLVMIAVIIASVIVYFFCGTTVTTVFKESRLRILSTNDFIFPYLFWSSAIAVICGVAICWRMTMIVSNRLAGPLFRMEQDICKVAEGDLSKPIRVRTKDEFKSLASLLNDLIGDWRKDINVLKNEMIQLNKSGNLDPKDRYALENIKRILSKYKV